MSPDRPHLLVAEDDPDLRDVLAEELTQAGFRVTTAPDGGAAAELLELQGLSDDDLHAVVFDVRMPESTGVELLRWLRGDERRIPVVLISGFTDDLGVYARELGAVLLPKPFSSASLVAAIDEARSVAGSLRRAG